MTESDQRRPRVIFFGSPGFAVPSLERVISLTDLVGVVTQPDRPAGRGQELAEPAVKQAARAGAPASPILQPEKIRTPEFHAALQALQADLFVVVAYGRILPQTILDLPRLGAWNVHASLLPRLRGAAPIQWAIINGDPETGVSVMRMEAGLDTGPVASRATTPIADQDTGGTLAARLSVVGADLLAKTLPSIVAGTVVVKPQDDGQATLAPILKKEDGRLDFSQPARLVSARARGVDPWPGATAPLRGVPIKLFGPRLMSGVLNGPGGQRPGTVSNVDSRGLHVACSDGEIVFEEVQLPGRKRVAAAAAAAGRALSAGDLLA